MPLQELYEPLWDSLYEASSANGHSIRGIWVADMAQMGMSGVLNESIMDVDGVLEPFWSSASAIDRTH